MPYEIRRNGSGKGTVINQDTGKPHSNHPIPMARAKAQMRLLYSKMGDEAQGPEMQRAAARHLRAMVALLGLVWAGAASAQWVTQGAQVQQGGAARGYAKQINCVNGLTCTTNGFTATLDPTAAVTGIGTSQIQNGAVTSAKLAPSALDPSGVLSIAQATATEVDIGRTGVPVKIPSVSGTMSDLRSCAAVYAVSAATVNVTLGGASRINFDTKVLDTDNAVATGASWVFTVPAGKGGLYWVAVQVGWNTGSLNTAFFAAQIWKNGSVWQYAIGSANPYFPGNGNWFTTTAESVLLLAPGDTISGGQINNQGAGTPQIAGNTQWSMISIFRIPGS